MINKTVLDEDLILLISKGNVKASEEFFKRYDGYSWRLAYDFHYSHLKSGISISDYHQVAFSSTVKAIKKYQIDTKNTFYAFWKKIALNDITRYYVENAYNTGGSNFNGLSFSYMNDDGFELSDHIGQEDRGIHDIIRRKELDLFVKEVIDSFKEDIDKEIVTLFLDGDTFEQIQMKTSSNYRHLTYVISRFQKLMSKILKKRNYN